MSSPASTDTDRTDLEVPGRSTEKTATGHSPMRIAVQDKAQDADAAPEVPMVEVQNVDLYYGQKKALKNVSLVYPQKRVTAMIGPSGCGKSTLLRCFNRMNDLVEGCRVEGSIKINGRDIYDPALDVTELRKNVGMVFQKPNPFPKSIFENIAYGPRLQGIKDKARLDEIVERSLKGAALWEEAKDRLNESALALSGGQQQRLCIARAVAVEPEVLLMDEPCSALDPIATAKVEELIHELRANFTIVIVTHSMQQAARVSQRTAMFHLGNLVEENDTDKMFTNPDDQRTQDYIMGRFG